MIKAVIFDCFGVLAQDGWLQFGEQHFHNEVERALARDLLKQHDTGILSAAEFGRKVAAMAGVSPEEVEKVISTHNTKNQPLLDYVAKLKSRAYKIGLLSNVGEDWLGHFLTTEERALFDDILLSYKVGLTKPDPLIYMMSADRLGVMTSECVFVDDRKLCTDGALNVGMQAILYESLESFVATIEPLLTTSI